MSPTKQKTKGSYGPLVFIFAQNGSKGETKKMKPNLANLLKSAQDTLIKHSPEILTGIGVAGMVTSTVLAVRATPKAIRLIEEEKRLQNRELLAEAEKNGLDNCDQVEKLKPLEVIKVAWKPYIPAAVTCIVSGACIIGATSVNLRRNAALATAYQLSSNALTEYKEKVIETLGEKKEQTIKEKVAKDRVDKNPVESKDVIITGKGKTLCCDVTFNQYFESDLEDIKRSINNLNQRLLSEEYVSLNDFYDELGIDRIEIGEDLGWNVGRDGLVDISFGTTMASDGRPCITLQYHVAPRYKFYKLM